MVSSQAPQDSFAALAWIAGEGVKRHVQRGQEPCAKLGVDEDPIARDLDDEKLQLQKRRLVAVSIVVSPRARPISY
jgi:hypothetical protein